jgi:hypothetical protein
MHAFFVLEEHREGVITRPNKTAGKSQNQQSQNLDITRTEQKES